MSHALYPLGLGTRVSSTLEGGRVHGGTRAAAERCPGELPHVKKEENVATQERHHAFAGSARCPPTNRQAGPIPGMPSKALPTCRDIGSDATLVLHCMVARCTATCAATSCTRGVSLGAALQLRTRCPVVRGPGWATGDRKESCALEPRSRFAIQWQRPRCKTRIHFIFEFHQRLWILPEPKNQS